MAQEFIIVLWHKLVDLKKVLWQTVTCPKILKLEFSVIYLWISSDFY